MPVCDMERNNGNGNNNESEEASSTNERDIHALSTQRAHRPAILLPSFRSPRLCNYDFIFMDINYTGCLAVSLYGILIQGCRHNGNPHHEHGELLTCLASGGEKRRDVCTPRRGKGRDAGRPLCLSFAVSPSKLPRLFSRFLSILRFLRFSSFDSSSSSTFASLLSFHSNYIDVRLREISFI